MVQRHDQTPRVFSSLKQNCRGQPHSVFAQSDSTMHAVFYEVFHKPPCLVSELSPAVGRLQDPIVSLSRASTLQSIPRPTRDAEAQRDIVGGFVVLRHGRRRSPCEVVV